MRPRSRIRTTFIAPAVDPAEPPISMRPTQELSNRADEVYAMFNNNNRSPDPRGSGELVAQAAANAVMFKQVLADAGVPAE